MRILIFGPSGQIGFELTQQAKEFAEVITAGRKAAGRKAAGRKAADHVLDLLDRSAISQLFSVVKPDVVINAVAYTAVDKAESEQDMAFQLNSDFPTTLADECAKLNCLLIHYSTDFVFDGTQKTPWKENAITNPLSVYGRSKLAGEKSIQLAHCPSLILRTSWVYGDRGGNFMLTMLRFARERESMSVVNDQIGSPSCSRDIAEATLKLCKRYKIEPDYVKSHSGIYHLTASGETSWYGFAKAIFAAGKLKESLAIKELLPITTSEYPTAATRPAYSVLDCQLIKETFDVEMTDWKTALLQSMDRYYLP